MSEEKNPTAVALDNAETMAAQEAAAPDAPATEPVDYTSEMGIDAHDIAAQLQADLLKGLQQKFPGLNIHTKLIELQKPDVPEPTLESLREMAARIHASFATTLTTFLEDRTKDRENSVARALVSYVSTGKADAARAYVARTEGADSLALQLSDAELTEVLAAKHQKLTLLSVALGIYAGAMLTRNGFTLEEVCNCAADGVFAVHTLALRVTPASINKLALDVFKDVAQAERARAQKTLD